MAFHLPFINHIPHNCVIKVNRNSSLNKIKKKNRKNSYQYKSMNKVHHKDIEIKSPFYQRHENQQKYCHCPYHRMKRYKQIVSIVKHSCNDKNENLKHKYKEKIEYSNQIFRSDNQINRENSLFTTFKCPVRFQRSTQCLPKQSHSPRKSNRSKIDNYNQIFEEILRMRMLPLQDHQKVSNLVKFIKINARTDEKYLNKQRYYICTQLQKVSQKVNLDKILQATDVQPYHELIHKIAHIIDVNQDIAKNFISGVQTAMKDFQSFIINNAKLKQIESQNVEKLISRTNKGNNQNYGFTNRDDDNENRNNGMKKDKKENDAYDYDNSKNENNINNENNSNMTSLKPRNNSKSRNAYSYSQQKYMDMSQLKKHEQKIDLIQNKRYINESQTKAEYSQNYQEKYQQQKLNKIIDKSGKNNYFLPPIQKQEQNERQEKIDMDSNFNQNFNQINTDIVICQWENQSQLDGASFQQKLQQQIKRNNANITNCIVECSDKEKNKIKKEEDINNISKVINLQKHEKENVDKETKQNSNKKLKYKKIKQNNKKHNKPQQGLTPYKFTQDNYDHIIGKIQFQQIESLLNENQIDTAEQTKIFQQFEEKLQNMEQLQEKLQHVLNLQQIEIIKKKFHKYQYDKLLSLLTKQVDACLFELKTINEIAWRDNDNQEEVSLNPGKILQQEQNKTLQIQCTNSNESLMEEFTKFRMVNRNQTNSIKVPVQQIKKDPNFQQKEVGEIQEQIVLPFNTKNKTFDETDLLQNDDHYQQFRKHCVNREKHLQILRYMKYKHGKIFNEVYGDIKNTLSNIAAEN